MTLTTRALFSFLLAVVVVLSLPLALSTATADAYLFQPDTYKKALVQDHFYDKMPSLLAQQLVSMPGFLEGAGPIDIDPQVPGRSVQKNKGQLKYLGASDYETILSELFPKDWLQAQTETAIDEFFSYANLNVALLRLQISMVEVKQRLRGPIGLQIVHRVVQSWPPCSLNLAETIAQQALAGSLAGIPVCSPPSNLVSVFDPVYRSVLDQLVKRIPDQVDLAYVLPGIKEIAGPPPNGSLASFTLTPWRMWAIYSAFRLSLRFSPAIFAISFLGLSGLVISTRKRFAWWGGSLAVGGLISLLWGLSGPTVVRSISGNLFRSISGGVAPVVMHFGQLLANQLLHNYFLWVTIESAVVLGLGVLLLLVWQAVRG